MKTLLCLSLLLLVLAVAVNCKAKEHGSKSHSSSKSAHSKMTKGAQSKMTKGAQSKIIKGEEAKLGQFPWQAGITIDDTSFCGGSIISDSWILTAAHCTEGAKDFKVRVGSLNIQGDSQDEMVDSKEGITHPGWDRKQLINDLGLVHLQTPLNFTYNIQPIRLPTRSQMDTNFTGEMVQDAGWGKLQDDTIYPSSTLKWIETTVISIEECRTLFGGTKPDSVLCVYSADGHALCEGDSGGPLVWQDPTDNLWTQLGINSYVSTKGCEADKPDITTRVVSFLDWISENTGIEIKE